MSLTTTLVMLALPLGASWACKEVEASSGAEEAFKLRYNCPQGYYNEIGSLLFRSREESIKDILTDPASFEPETLLSSAGVFLGLMVVTFGISVPSGMFMPTVLVGAYGRILWRHISASGSFCSSL